MILSILNSLPDNSNPIYYLNYEDTINLFMIDKQSQTYNDNDFWIRKAIIRYGLNLDEIYNKYITERKIKSLWLKSFGEEKKIKNIFSSSD